MKFLIRSINIPQDYSQIAELLNIVLFEETDAETLREEDSKIPVKGSLTTNENGLLIGHDRYRIVAVEESGRIVGYGISWRAPWTAAGELNHDLVVHPEFRNYGIGKELYRELENWAKSNGASKLNYEVRDDEEHSIAFAIKNGFEKERHLFESVLDLSKYDDSNANVMNNDVTICSLSEISDPDKVEKLYEIYKETSYDIPGSDREFYDFNEWKKWTLELPGSGPDYILVAMKQDEFVGVAHMLYHESTQTMYHEYTGVNKRYRGQRIGLTLKIKCIELAKNLNMKYLRANNDSLNEPMLRINRGRLGFKPVPGMYIMIKHL